MSGFAEAVLVFSVFGLYELRSSSTSGNDGNTNSDLFMMTSSAYPGSLACCDRWLSPPYPCCHDVTYANNGIRCQGAMGGQLNHVRVTSAVMTGPVSVKKDMAEH